MTISGIQVEKQNKQSSFWEPLETGTVTIHYTEASRVRISDGERRDYFSSRPRPGKACSFTVRGSAGVHEISVEDSAGTILEKTTFRLRAQTSISCNKGPYSKLATRIQNLLRQTESQRSLIINERLYKMLVTWGRDHMHTLKTSKYFMEDVTSGLQYWLDSQEDNGMFWDCIHHNPNGQNPTIFGEALGEGYYRYDDDMRYIVRRIPVEADVEFLYTEGVWYAWKATGDDAWLSAQMPKLEKALKYNNSHPTRWSKKHGLVRRSFCMDSWDFVNPHYCSGDHRVINPGDPQFLFHSDNSGLYASYWRMAEMYEALGNEERAQTLRNEGEALRKRANKKLFFKSIYGHMIPETLPEKEVYGLVGDERERMSLSTGYTINRKLPTHDMAVKILKEYQRRSKAKRAESFAEWWAMDPPYTRDQWPKQGPPPGEYMNGSICPIVAGEIAKAAFDHGCEDYGADILKRVWKLTERDNGNLHQAYRRLPENPTFPKWTFSPVNLRAVVNRGWKQDGKLPVEGWTGELDNDMRNIPVGKRKCGLIEFDIIDPAKNDGKSVMRLSYDSDNCPRSVTVSADGKKGKSVYFLHSTAYGSPRNAIIAVYTVCYADGTEETIYVRNGGEIGHWWGIVGINESRKGWDAVDHTRVRVAWQGPNPTWKRVGMYMFGWDNPHPDKAITAIRISAEKTSSGGDLMLGAISISDGPVQFEERIRSYGLPNEWSQAAVYYAVAEGLAGIEDKGRAFDNVKISPRWVATETTAATVTLHYPASGGYCSYSCKIDEKRRKITIDITGSFKNGLLHCLLPRGAKPKKVRIGRRELDFTVEKIEQSVYVDVALDELPDSPLVIEF